MTETIRYAVDVSSLGPFISAVSERGLVAFEFGESPTALVDAVGARFPDACLENDPEGLSKTTAALARLVDHPAVDPRIPLDMRGTDYQKRVWEMLRQIPPGETTNYGAIAAQLGTRDAREVTDAIASNTIAILVPCHRVIRKDGSLSGYRWGTKRKRALLDREKAESS